MREPCRSNTLTLCEFLNMLKNNNKTIAILGAGSWGSALAILLARNGYQINLWGKFKEEIEPIKQNHSNEKYLPGIKFPENIILFTEIATALKTADEILIVVPSHAFRETLQLIKPFLSTNSRLAFASKGLDSENKLLHESVKEIIGDIPTLILSGPTFAREVASGLPTAITAAANNHIFAENWASYLHNNTFRVYTSNDLVGVQIGGAVKNVLAIAVGIADGLDLGSNARCALITRGLAELTRLGLNLGGKMETFMGLAGLGDLVLTCTDNQSRNRRFGLAIGKGEKLDNAMQMIGQVIEGYPNAKSVLNLAKKYQIEMPICEQVYKILYEDLSPKNAVKILLDRKQKSEI